MEQILDWLSNPLNKAVLLFAGGEILKRWGSVIRRAIPVVLLAISTLLEVLRALFPGVVPDVKPASFAESAHAVSGAFLGTIVPVLIAVGAHSKYKNTVQWILEGAKLFKKPA